MNIRVWFIAVALLALFCRFELYAESPTTLPPNYQRAQPDANGVYQFSLSRGGAPVKAGRFDALPETIQSAAYAAVKVTAPQPRGRNEGTGAILHRDQFEDRQWRVLTANHVIANARRGVKVGIMGVGWIAAEVEGTSRSPDLALLIIRPRTDTFRDGIEAVALYLAADPPSRGETVYCWGYTHGADRAHLKHGPFMGSGSRLFNVTAERVNSGDSGGALVNEAGNLVGIIDSTDRRSGGNGYGTNLRSVKLWLTQYG